MDKGDSPGKGVSLIDWGFEFNECILALFNQEVTFHGEEDNGGTSQGKSSST